MKNAQTSRHGEGLPSPFKRKIMQHIYAIRNAASSNVKSVCSKKFYLVFLFCLLGLVKSWGQTYATSQTNDSWKVLTLLGGNDAGSAYHAAGNFLDPTYSSVTNEDRTTDGDYTNYATMTATASSVLVAGARGYSVIKFNFGSNISGNTAYIRIDQPTASGGSLSLLGIVGDLTNLISKNVIYGKAYSNTTPNTANATTVSTLVKDVNGNLYLAVTSAQAFQYVEIYLNNSSLLLDLQANYTFSMNVYYAATNYPNDNCSGAKFSDVGAVTGISVGLTDAVTNPENALKNDGTAHSTLGAALGSIAGVGSSISQSFYFPQKVTSGRQVKLDIQLPANLLDLNLLNNITIQAYNGTTTVGSAIPLSSVIRLDLLGLFSDPGVHAVHLTPAGDFDKIQLSLNAGINVGLGNGLYIFGIHSVPPKPTLSLTRIDVYSGVPMSPLSVTNAGSSTINWYDHSQSLIGAGASFTPAPFTHSDTIYAVATDAGCSIPSDSAKFAINVLSTAPTKTQYTVTPYKSDTLSLTTTGNVTSLQTPGFKFLNAQITPAGSGLTVESNGIITGTPQVIGTYSIISDVEDSINHLQVGQKAFSLSIPTITPITYAKELTAQAQNASVVLNWETATEINNDHFDVQRSADGKTWSSVGTMKSAFATGNGNGHTYSYTDRPASNGTYYYKLTQYDKDGKNETGRTVSVTFNGTGANAMAVYPNPVQSSFRIRNAVAGSNYRIVNIAGQNIKAGILNNPQQDINVSELAAGIYFVELTSNGQTLSKLKFVKQ